MILWFKQMGMMMMIDNFLISIITKHTMAFTNLANWCGHGAVGIKPALFYTHRKRMKLHYLKEI